MLFRTSLSPVPRLICLDLSRGYKTRFGQFCPRKCHSRSCAPSIPRSTRGEVWLISRRQMNLRMWGSPKQSMRSGVGRGSKDGGAGTGIRALWHSNMLPLEPVFRSQVQATSIARKYCAEILHVIWIAKETKMPELQNITDGRTQKEVDIKHSQSAGEPEGGSNVDICALQW
jgi:hypothetical protein